MLLGASNMTAMSDAQAPPSKRNSHRPGRQWLSKALVLVPPGRVPR